jgi:hypothetical protein
LDKGRAVHGAVPKSMESKKVVKKQRRSKKRSWQEKKALVS